MRAVRHLARLLAVAALAVTGLTVVAPAHATEDPGIYDITLDRAVYDSTGQMTVTWRSVYPATATGTKPSTQPSCTVSVDGTPRTSTKVCHSGQPFSYDLTPLGGNGNLTITIKEPYADSRHLPVEPHLSGTTTAIVDPTDAYVGILSTQVAGGSGDQVTSPLSPHVAYSTVASLSPDITAANAHFSYRRTAPTSSNPVSVAPFSISSGTGRWNFQLPAVSGTYALTVDVTDPYGRTASDTVSYEVDADAPIVTLTSPADGATYDHSQLEVSATANEPVQFYCSQNPDAGAGSYQVCGYQAFVTSMPPGWILGALEGTQKFGIEAVDAQGNASDPVVSTFTVDTTAPVLTLNAPVDGSTFTSVPVAYSVGASEPVKLLCSINPDAGPGSYGDCSFGQTKTSWTGGLRFNDRGTHRYGFAGVDAAGNRSAPVTFTYTYKPAAGFTWQSGPRDGIAIHAGAPTWEWTSDAGDATYECSLTPSGAAADFAPCTSPYTAAESLGVGGYDFAVRTSGTDVTPAVSTASFTVQPDVAGSAVIGGKARVGSKLSVGGGWTPGTTLSYQWLRDGTVLPGAATASYVPVVADLGHRISVRVVGAQAGFFPATITSAARLVGKGVLASGKARIAGRLKVGKRLTASASPWTRGTKVHYRWFAGKKAIKGATHAKLKLKKKFAGKRIKVRITGSRAGYATRVLTARRTGRVHR
jgi:hypothetical protein